AHSVQLAKIITAENGKLLSESYAEIDSTLHEMEFQVGEGLRQFGVASECPKANLIGMSRKEPLGVVSAITPWNFPFNVPFRKLVPAMMAGNTVILKPAGQTPAVGELVALLLLEAGLPGTALQFVTGSGSELSTSLVAHSAVEAVTFTGSTEVGRDIATLAAKTFTRTQLEMGGKNPIVVLEDADLDSAADAIIVGAFSCAGQWCTATSRVIVQDSVADDLVSHILTRINKIVVGPGNTSTSTMGPVCGKHQLHSILEHIESAQSEGAVLISPEGSYHDLKREAGCFIAPTVFDQVEQSMNIAKDEVFGPVLSIMRVKDYTAALDVANDVVYGLSSSIFTNNYQRAMHFVEHTEVGLTHVNMHSAYKEPHLCFGGYKESGFGLPEAGSTGIQFFQEEKAIYLAK
ncbi:MAG: aldehyde dehydrogenase family protein, partial [Pseudomonadota bacterium]